MRGLVLGVERLLLLFRHGGDLGLDLLLEELGRRHLPRRRLAFEEPLGDLVVEDLALGLVLLGPELEQARARRLLELARGERLSGDGRHDIGRPGWAASPPPPGTARPTRPRARRERTSGSSRLLGSTQDSRSAPRAEAWAPAGLPAERGPDRRVELGEVGPFHERAVHEERRRPGDAEGRAVRLVTAPVRAMAARLQAGREGPGCPGRGLRPGG